MIIDGTEVTEIERGGIATQSAVLQPLLTLKKTATRPLFINTTLFNTIEV